MILSQVAGAAGDLRETNVRTYYFTHRAVVPTDSAWQPHKGEET